MNGPNLWMLVYDSTLSAAEAYSSANGEYVLVNVDATVTVTIDPVFIRYRDGTGAYQYHVTLNSAPNQASTCDVSGKMRNPLGEERYFDCSALFLFRIQSFQSSVLHERRKLEWGDFGASVGAYFALIQAGSWVLSLVAFAR
ncbi:hypothetical protein HII31_06051 [Pseudocercospora fuligena]|uniref:Uncharacterized protein n=1 Tax=Pseudocercospora fuligena TaxID=685502 RepID=A0A8H6RKB2_9PEZI|nr:hypothetical protein HII31_06051 [Pseudocercospora fuligena]